jgi:hypothetical protein
MARNKKESEMDVQTGENLLSNQECACCGKKNPEYSLEDKELCLECYRTEIDFWAKGSLTT